MNNTANLIRLAVVLIAVLLLQVVVFDNLDFKSSNFQPYRR